MKKKALILGVDGQDGSLMSDFLIKKNIKLLELIGIKNLKSLGI